MANYSDSFPYTIRDVDKHVGPVTLPNDEAAPVLTAGRTLIQLSHVVVRLEDRLLLHELGLSYRQMRILKHIHSGVTSATELGRIFGVTAPAVSETVESLVKKGLVTREPHESDRRAVKLDLTKQGAAANEKAHDLERRLAHEILGVLDEPEVDELLNLSTKVLVPSQENLISRRLNHQ